jgi:DNA-binding MarR family transcriptional regulator
MPKKTRHTAAGKACTELILETFRLNGRLLLAGDALTREMGLTSARWQVLGAIDNAHASLSVAQIARNMGLRRQGIQRVVDLLRAKGLVAFTENPRHLRAKLVSMTAKGKTIYHKTGALQAAWVNELSAGMNPAQLASAATVLRMLQRRLSN